MLQVYVHIPVGWEAQLCALTAAEVGIHKQKLVSERLLDDPDRVKSETGPKQLAEGDMYAYSDSRGKRVFL